MVGEEGEGAREERREGERDVAREERREERERRRKGEGIEWKVLFYCT